MKRRPDFTKATMRGGRRSPAATVSAACHPPFRRASPPSRSFWDRRWRAGSLERLNCTPCYSYQRCWSCRYSATSRYSARARSPPWRKRERTGRSESPGSRSTGWARVSGNRSDCADSSLRGFDLCRSVSACTPDSPWTRVAPASASRYADFADSADCGSHVAQPARGSSSSTARQDRCRSPCHHRRDRSRPRDRKPFRRRKRMCRRRRRNLCPMSISETDQCVIDRPSTRSER